MKQNGNLDFFALGVSHKQAPLAVREQLSVSSQNSSELLGHILKVSGAEGGVLLSTCNRTELYLSGGDLQLAQAALFGEHAKEGEQNGWFYHIGGTDAIVHLFRVTSGLESLILGEDEILRQVKKAYGLSAGNKQTDSFLNTVFHAALRTSKKIKTDTGLSSIALSVGTIAVNRAKEVLGDLSGKRLLVIGLGEVGHITLKDFLDQGVMASVTYRDYHRTRGKLVAEGDKLPENLRLIPYSDRSQYYNDADIIVSATAAPYYAVTGTDYFTSVTTEKTRVLVDLAVPRDIDCSITCQKGCVYYNIDDLQAISDDNLLLREQKSKEAAVLIEEAVAEFEKQWLFRTNRPLVEKMKLYAKSKAERPLRKAISGLEDNGLGLQKVFMDSFDGMLENMVFQVRESVDKQDLEAFFRCLRSVLERDAMDDLEKSGEVVYVKHRSA